MNMIERARMIGLFATAAGLLAVACVYAQAAVWPVAGLLGAGAVVCADAALNVQEKARELHAAACRSDRPEVVRLTPAEVALSDELTARLHQALDEAEPEIPDSMGNVTSSWLHMHPVVDGAVGSGWQEADQ